MDIMQAALEMRKALQMFVGTLDVENHIEIVMVIAYVLTAF